MDPEIADALNEIIVDFWQRARGLARAFGPEEAEELIGRVAVKLCRSGKSLLRVEYPKTLTGIIVCNERCELLKQRLNQADIVIERLRQEGLKKDKHRRALEETLDRLAHRDGSYA